MGSCKGLKLSFASVFRFASPLINLTALLFCSRIAMFAAYRRSNVPFFEILAQTRSLIYHTTISILIKKT